MKKFLCFLMVFSFCFSAFAVTDIGGHWAEDYISGWIEMGNISGYPDGTFRPNNSITRAEFAALLNRIMVDIPESAEYQDVTFADVAEDAWFYGDVYRLATFSIISKADNFYPNRNITREEAMVMIYRAFGYTPEDEKAFADSDKISPWAKDAVSALVALNIVSGYPDGTIRPKVNLTRAETVKMLDTFAPKLNLETVPGILEAVYKKSGKEFFGMMQSEINAENSEYFIGIPFDKIAEGYASEPMMSAQAHSVCLVRVKDKTQAVNIAAEIKNNVDPRKWVCVGIERSEIITVVRGDLILLIMDRAAPKALERSFLNLDLGDEYPVQQQVSVSEDSTDKNTLYNYNGQYINDFGEYSEASALKFAEKINYITDTYLDETASAYYAVIPSKNYYANAYLPTPFDYDGLFTTLRQNIFGAGEINLFDVLSYDDYLITDFHWKQESLQGVLNRLGMYLNFSVDLNTFDENKVEGFVGQLGYGNPNFPKETITYLTNEHTENAVVDNYQDKNFNKVYDTAKLSTTSQYDLFLSGPTPLTTIKNDNGKSDRKLIIFRDSFGSSLAPLLIGKYKEIVLIDIRYVMSSTLSNFVDFSGADVLFLYNDQVINNATMLK
ncbi:MAG: S-layer homology domain-containing protein [Clostridia bacterium]|nr:S-layer homology domain-containing protein [Clostridia bacterium]